MDLLADTEIIGQQDAFHISETVTVSEKKGGTPFRLKTAEPNGQKLFPDSRECAASVRSRTSKRGFRFLRKSSMKKTNIEYNRLSNARKIV